MTRICEKFVEEISSGSASVSDELKQHLAGCPDCKAAFDSVNSLKRSRKPMNAKEAAAISLILKAIKTETAASAASSATTAPGAAAAVAKLIMAATVVIALVMSVFSEHRITVRPDDKPITITNSGNSGAESPSGNEAITTGNEIDNSVKIAEKDDFDSMKTASTTDVLDSSDKPVEENASEVKSILVSPDQEELQPR